MTVTVEQLLELADEAKAKATHLQRLRLFFKDVLDCPIVGIKEMPSIGIRLSLPSDIVKSVLLTGLDAMIKDAEKDLDCVLSGAVLQLQDGPQPVPDPDDLWNPEVHIPNIPHDANGDPK